MAALDGLPLDLVADCLHGPPRRGPVAARVEERRALEDGELAAQAQAVPASRSPTSSPTSGSGTSGVRATTDAAITICTPGDGSPPRGGPTSST